MLFIIFVSFISYVSDANIHKLCVYKHCLTIKRVDTLLYEERKLDSNTKHCCIMP